MGTSKSWPYGHLRRLRQEESGDGATRKSRVTSEILPDEVVWNILAILPFGRLFCFRSVCKKWNSFLKDPLFQKLWARIHGGDHCLFYHEFMRRVPSKLKRYSVTVSTGFFSVIYGLDSCVVDPASAYLKKIPRIPPALTISGDWRYVGMVVSPGTKNFRIFATSHAIRRNLSRMYEYHSTNNAWHLAQFPCESVGSDRFLRSVVMHEDSLYFLIQLRKLIPGARPRVKRRYTCYFRVARCEERNSCWEYLVGELPAIKAIYDSPPLLFGHGGKLFLAALFLDRYCIWQYNDEMAEWILFDRFPHDFTIGAEDRFNLGFCAQCCGDILYVTKWTSPDCVVPSVMIYSLVNRQCKEMSSDEKERKLVRLWGRPKFIFQPVY